MSEGWCKGERGPLRHWDLGGREGSRPLGGRGKTGGRRRRDGTRLGLCCRWVLGLEKARCRRRGVCLGELGSWAVESKMTATRGGRQTVSERRRSVVGILVCSSSAPEASRAVSLTVLAFGVLACSVSVLMNGETASIPGEIIAISLCAPGSSCEAVVVFAGFPGVSSAGKVSGPSPPLPQPPAQCRLPSWVICVGCRLSRVSLAG